MMSISPAFPFLLDERYLSELAESNAGIFQTGTPFPHIVIDDFLPQVHAQFLVNKFPAADNPVWLDWRKRAPNQYRKQGPGNSYKFSLLDPSFLLALQEFNSWKFLSFLERLTGFENLLPDPYFFGGGMHQILPGGVLDIHTDFTIHSRLGLFRQLNVLIYLNEGWKPDYEGCLELWSAEAEIRKCEKSIAPIFNRAVVFHTSKRSFHGHPKAWNAPDPITRKSIALYYYTTYKLDDHIYDNITNFQGISTKEIKY